MALLRARTSVQATASSTPSSPQQSKNATQAPSPRPVGRTADGLDAPRAARPPAPPPEPQLAPAVDLPTLSVAQLLRGDFRRLPISELGSPDSDAVRAATLLDRTFGDSDGTLDSDELEGLERISIFRGAQAGLREALLTRGTAAPAPFGPPPEGAPAMAVALPAVPERLRPLATFVDGLGNRDGTLDSREVTEHALDLVRRSGGAPLTEANLGVLRQLYRLTNAGTPLAGTRMRADGVGQWANWPPAASRSLAAPAGVTAERMATARRLVVAAGSATQADVEVVAAQVARMPLPMLRSLEAGRIPIRVGRESVIDVEPGLASEHPRGWHTGKTFADVVGIYHPASGSVVVATAATASGGRQVKLEHGSLDLLVHEVGHALDYHGFGPVAGKLSDSPEFVAAFEADLPSLRSAGRDYLTQADGGREEAFAEELAAYVVGDQFMPELAPHLRGYFDQLFERAERTPARVG